MSYQSTPNTTPRPEPTAETDAQLVALYDEFQDACDELAELEAADTEPFSSPDTQHIEHERGAAVDAVSEIVYAAADLPAQEPHGMHAKAVLARHAAESLFESGEGSGALMTPEAALILSFIADVERQAYTQLTGAVE